MSPNESRSTTQDRPKRNRLTATAIMLIPLAVVVAATALWWAVQRGYIDIVGALGTHNHGHLVDPVRQFDRLTLRRLDGSEFRYGDLPAKWTLAIPGDVTCGDACRERLWLTRQLHTALGRRAQHLRRLYLTTEWPLADELSAYLAAEHTELLVIQADPLELDQLRSSLEYGDRPAFYLVDKRGYLMMFYTDENTGKEVVSDLKFLMKQVGDD